MSNLNQKMGGGARREKWYKKYTSKKHQYSGLVQWLGHPSRLRPAQRSQTSPNGDSGSCVAQSKAGAFELWTNQVMSAQPIYYHRYDYPALNGMMLSDADSIAFNIGTNLESVIPSEKMTDAQLDTLNTNITPYKATTKGVAVAVDADHIADAINQFRGVSLVFESNEQEWDCVGQTPVYQGGRTTFGHCFTFDTKVLTDIGYKNISDIKVGDLVMTDKGRFKKVSKIMNRPYSGQLLGIKAKNGIETVWVTPEHPFLSREISKKTKHKRNTISQGLDKFEYVPVSELTSDSVLVNQLFSEEKDIGINKDLAFLIGAYIGDGNTTDYKIRFSLGLNKKNKGLAMRITNLMMENFNLESHTYTVKNEKCIQLVFYSKKIVEFFRKYGGYPKNKIIHPDFFYAKKEIIKNLIEGLRQTDGCDIDDNFQIFNTSKNVTYGLKILLDKLGYSYNIQTRNPKLTMLGRLINSIKPLTIFDIYPKAKRFWGIYLFKKQFVRIKEIENKEFSGLVYNLEVEEDNSYVVDGMTVHNCILAFDFYVDAKGVRTFVCNDSDGVWSAPDGLRYITEDFLKQRCFGASYNPSYTNFPYIPVPNNPQSWNFFLWLLAYLKTKVA